MKNENGFSLIDFRNVTPDIQIAKVNFSSIYEKAFLSEMKGKNSEFSRDNTAED